MNAKRLPCTISRIKPAGADGGTGWHRREKKHGNYTIPPPPTFPRHQTGAQPCNAHGHRAGHATLTTLLPPGCSKLGSARKEKKQRAKHARMTHRGPYQTEKVCSYPPS